MNEAVHTEHLISTLSQVMLLAARKGAMPTLVRCACCLAELRPTNRRDSSQGQALGSSSSRGAQHHSKISHSETSPSCKRLAVDADDLQAQLDLAEGVYASREACTGSGRDKESL